MVILKNCKIKFSVPLYAFVALQKLSLNAFVTVYFCKRIIQDPQPQWKQYKKENHKIQWIHRIKKAPKGNRYPVTPSDRTHLLVSKKNMTRINLTIMSNRITDKQKIIINYFLMTPYFPPLHYRSVYPISLRNICLVSFPPFSIYFP